MCVIDKVYIVCNREIIVITNSKKKKYMHDFFNAIEILSVLRAHKNKPIEIKDKKHIEKLVKNFEKYFGGV